MEEEAEMQAAEQAAIQVQEEEDSDVDDDADEGFLQENVDDLTSECAETIEAYIQQISEMTVMVEAEKGFTSRMADSLAQIDPNTENGSEGRAFIRKMYKLRNKSKTLPVEPLYPETPDQCWQKVAGKVLLIEQLQE